MIQLKNSYGTIRISDIYLANLVSNAVKSCFGVVGMATTSKTQGIRQMLSPKSEISDKGVHIREINNQLEVDLHLILTYGLNVEAIVRSIINKTSFVVEQSTGRIVRKVNVYVDGMLS